MVFSLAFGGLILACNGSLTLNLLCISDCYVIPEGTWRSRGRGTGDFIVTNPHCSVSRSCIVTLLSSCYSFLLSLANTFVSAPLLLPFPCPQCFLGSGSDVSCLRRLPRVLRPRATWAQVWREILNPREVHAKKKNKDGFPFPQYRPVKVYKIAGILAAIVK